MKPMPLLISALLSFLPAIPAAMASQTAQGWFGERGYVAPAATRIIACHGYGCSRRTTISVDGILLSRAAALLKSARHSPEAERRALRELIRTYTSQLAASFGGMPDVPGSPPGMSGVHGQMDCLDETANTTSLLLVLQNQNLLTHHLVERPQTRGFFIDGRYPHTTAVIMEKGTRSEWAVDPWAKPPGQHPDILPLAVWRQES